MRSVIFVIVLTGWLGLSGCSPDKKGGGDTSSGPGQSRALQQVDAIHTFADPTTVNLDGHPDPDGVVATFYFENTSSAKSDSIAIHSGKLSCMVYDSAASDSTDEPFYKWEFTAGQLQRFTIDSFLGTGYRMALPWGKQKPKGQTVTLLAQFTDVGRPMVASKPVTITVIHH